MLHFFISLIFILFSIRDIKIPTWFLNKIFTIKHVCSFSLLDLWMSIVKKKGINDRLLYAQYKGEISSTAIFILILYMK